MLDASWQKGGVLFAKTFPDQNTDISVNDLAREYVQEMIRSIVKDSGVAADLVPVYAELLTATDAGSPQ